MKIIAKIYFFLFFLILTVLAIFPSRALAQTIDPQYVFLRKENTCANCILWNGNNPSNYSTAAVSEIINGIGTKGTSTRRLGVGAIFEPNYIDLDKTKQSLANLLNTSLVNDFPVYLSLDNFNWWEGRPDLWNWWDPSKPGYDPNNKANVEWTDWDGDVNNNHVLKISWTNWGIQFRRPPAPNLLSQKYITNSQDNLNQLLPIIVSWYNSLPADKKYLLGGVDMGNELDIGGNYYYYPNGNSYLDKDPSNDPKVTENFLASTAQLGYAALKTGNIKSSGTITTEDLNEAVRRYLDTLTKYAYDAGIPRNKIFNHTGGKGASPDWLYPNYPVFTDLRSSLMPYAQPGWSFYGDVTSTPQNYRDLNNVLDRLGKTQWAVPEWLTWATDYNGWLGALRGTLNYRNNRLINIANWEGIRNKQYILDAIKTVVNEAPSCWVTTPDTTNVSVNGNIATITWQKGTNNDAVFLNVSTMEEFTEAGTLKTINTVNDVVTNKNSYTINNLRNGTYYWTIVADGCGNQRKIAYGTFTINNKIVDISDLRNIIANFLNLYTIFDYNKLVENFGK